MDEPEKKLDQLPIHLMSPGKKADLSNMFLAQTSSSDYELLCRMDVLGSEDRPVGDQSSVYKEFKEQLVRSPEGWYETGLPWRANHPPLQNNERGSIRRLGNLLKKLEKQPDLMTKYNGIIQDQIDQGIVEKVKSQPTQQRKSFSSHTSRWYAKQPKVRKFVSCMMRRPKRVIRHLPLTTVWRQVHPCKTTCGVS